LHKGTRLSGGNLAGDQLGEVTKLLDEFTDIVSAQVTQQRLRRAVVRSMLPCNLVLVLDDSSLSVAAEKSVGMPSTTAIDKRGQTFSAQAVYEGAKWEFGYDEAFVIQFPSDLLSSDKETRVGPLTAIAMSHIQSEVNRVRREMNIIQINPVFGPASYTIDNRLVFVLMPFDEDLTQIYNSILKRVIESQEFGLVCRRADELKTNRAIMQDIWKAICESRLIIADLTRLNPNVMYELGMAHTVGKETILIYQRQEQEIRFPFDLAHIRRIEYTNSAVGGKQLEEELKATLRNLLAPTVRLG
jgi:hypothetical protein